LIRPEREDYRVAFYSQLRDTLVCEDIELVIKSKNY
jgi:hypothetical protein